jgi:hypothetical protein
LDDEVWVRLEEPRVRLGAADDHVDMLNELMGG